MSNKKNAMGISLYNVSLWLGSTALVISGIALIIWKTLNDIIVALVLMGILVLVSSLFYYLGMEKPVKDERLRKIGTLSATYSWLATLGFMCFLMVSGYWSHRVFAQEELFGLIMFVMVVSMLVINAYLSRRGDVE
jgi:hypothetical protein